MTRILITGVSGLLGLNLAMDACQNHQVTGVANTHSLAGAPFGLIHENLQNFNVIPVLLEQVCPDLVIHCAAQANLETCENDPAGAEQINALLPGELAYQSGKRGIRMVHISTDAVFDGQIPLPSSLAPIREGYREEDSPNPLSVYARTKLEGERAVASANPNALIARVNFYGWSLSGRRSLAEFFFNHLSAGQRVNGFTDVYFCPLYVKELGRILLTMADLDLHGIYHVVSSEAISKDAFGRKLAQQFHLDESLITATSVMAGGLKAARSPNLVLSTVKLANALGYPLPGIATGLEYFFQEFTEGYPASLRGMNS